ncbi:MAG: hypothetical protein KBA61_05790 [Spirochaetes bacterium]|nr:hypothetical protein [Spirochaetota bacterium]
MKPPTAKKLPLMNRMAPSERLLRAPSILGIGISSQVRTGGLPHAESSNTLAMSPGAVGKYFLHNWKKPVIDLPQNISANANGTQEI